VPDYEYIKNTYRDKALDETFVTSLINDYAAKVNKTIISFKKLASWGIRKTEFEMTATKKIRRFLYKDFDKALAGD
jgi:hypothetical protein